MKAGKLTGHGAGKLAAFPDAAAANQTERAVLGIRELVLRGTFRAGERLTEVALSARLGVSRTPIRSALLRLTDEGLLEPAANTGFVVRGFSQAEIADAIELRGTLEGLAARMAAERCTTPERLAAMRACLGQIDELLAGAVPGDSHLARYSALNAEFHRLLLDAAESAMLQGAMAKIAALPFASPSAFFEAQATLPGSLDILRHAQRQHWDIVEAIAERSSARAEPLVREHARNALKNLELVLRDQAALQQLAGGALIRHP